jgi:tripartite-type tricarboxylate transporter receptor subunit TctC
MAESGVAGYGTSWWVAAWAPTGTPQEIVDLLQAVVLKSLAAQKPVSYFNAIAASPMPLTSEQLAKFQVSERGRWARIIAASGVKPQ